jgi:hypothetical protein
MSENRDFIGTTENENTPEPDFMAQHFADAGIVEEKNEGDSSESGTNTESGNSTEGTAPSQDQIKGESGKDSLGGAKDGGSKQGKEKEGKNPGDNLPPGALKLKDGTVVAAGAERRWFDQMNLARDRLRDTTNQLNTINQKFTNLQTKYDAVANTVKDMGLMDPQHMTIAVKMFNDLQANPTAFVTNLLAELKAKGHNIDALAPGVDTRAIEAILDRRLGPSEQGQGKKTAEQVAQEVDAEVQELIGSFPDALMHEAYIAAFVDQAAQSGVNLPLRDAYFQLRERVINDGLDWTQPLGPQLQARKEAAQGGQQKQQQQPQEKQPAPRPNGRLPQGASEEIDPQKAVAVAANSSWDDIIRGSMQDAGYKI